MRLHPVIALFLELKRRRVIRVAVAYAACAAATMQVVDVAFPALHLPYGAVTLVVVLCILGLPVVLVLAWAFDVTADGIRSEPLAPTSLPLALSRRARLLLYLLGTVVLLAGGASFWVAHGRRSPPPVRPPGPVRLAVLYFDDRTPDGSLQYLADALTEALIDQLSSVSALSVAPQAGVAPFRGGHVGLDSIARALHAAVLVGGSVARSGDSVRVMVHLTDAASGTVVGAQTIDRPWREPFALVDELVQQVSTSLRKEVGRELEVKRWRAGTTREDAWRALQGALSDYNDITPIIAAGDLPAAVRTLLRADSTLARAERLDPAWPVPVVQRARNAGELALLLGLAPAAAPGLSATGTLARALDHARRAVALAPGDARALEVRGTLRFRQWQAEPGGGADSLLAGAEADLQAAVSADPTRAAARNVLTTILLAQGRFAEAELAAEAAYQADAYLQNAGSTVWALFLTSFELRRDAQARRWCHRVRDLHESGHLDAWWFAYCSLELLAWGQPAPPPRTDPWPVVGLARGDPPAQLAAVGPRLELLAAAVLARSGRRDSARAVATRALAAGPNDPLGRVLGAAIELLAGNRRGAVDSLRGALKHPLPGARQVVAGRIFAPLRGDPDYEALLARLR